MFKLSLITLISLIIFTWNQMTDGIVCYTCYNCNDPFNRKYVGVLYENDTSSVYYCSKTSVRYNTSRSIALGCTPYGAIGNGQWCCQSDLCNGVRINILANHFYVCISVLILKILN